MYSNFIIQAMDKTMDFYAELGVAPEAEPDVIRAAYRALAKRYHPDRQGGEVWLLRPKWPGSMVPTRCSVIQTAAAFTTGSVCKRKPSL